jgi:large subunit GTPase 1
LSSAINISSRLQSGEELLELFRQAVKSQYTKGVTTVGMVGYPNVGKSSTINAILKTKKVPVSATPGRTKHFQVGDMIERVYIIEGYLRHE